MKVKEKILRWWFRNHPAELEVRGLLTQEDVKEILGNMDFWASKSLWNEKFVEMVPFLHKYSDALEFLEQYDFPRKLYFEHLYDTHPERRLGYQKAILSTDERGQPKYPEILHRYKGAYMFLPETREYLEQEGKSYLLE